VWVSGLLSVDVTFKVLANHPPNKRKITKKLTNGFKLEGTEEEIVAGAFVHLAET
jgi:hypothetical protein